MESPNRSGKMFDIQFLSKPSIPAAYLPKFRPQMVDPPGALETTGPAGEALPSPHSSPGAGEWLEPPFCSRKPLLHQLLYVAL